MPASSCTSEPRRFRFSLRTLLLWILALSVLLGAGRWVYVRTWLQARVVAGLRALDAEAEYDGPYHTWPSGEGSALTYRVVVGVNLAVPFRSDQDAREANRLLGQLPYLTRIRAQYGLSGHKLTDREERTDRHIAEALTGLRIDRLQIISTPLGGRRTVDWICQTPSIERLELNDWTPSPAELALLCRAPHICELSLGNVHLASEHLQVLASAQQLRELALYSEYPFNEVDVLGGIPDCDIRLGARNIGDEDLRDHVAALPNLTDLSLFLEAPSAEALAALVRAKKLRRLSLQDASVGDREVASLANLRALEELNLGGTDVTETGLACFRHCPELKSLTIPDTLNIARVRALLPNVEHVSQFWSPPHHAELRQKRKIAADAARRATAEDAPSP